MWPFLLQQQNLHIGMPVANLTHAQNENQAKEQYPITSPVLQVVKLGEVRAEGADVGVELVSRKGCMKTLGCGGP